MSSIIRLRVFLYSKFVRCGCTLLPNWRGQTLLLKFFTWANLIKYHDLFFNTLFQSIVVHFPIPILVMLFSTSGRLQVPRNFLVPSATYLPVFYWDSDLACVKAVLLVGLLHTTFVVALHASPLDSGRVVLRSFYRDLERPWQDTMRNTGGILQLHACLVGDHQGAVSPPLKPIEAASWLPSVFIVFSTSLEGSFPTVFCGQQIHRSLRSLP